MRNWRRLRRSKRLKKNVRFENDAFAKQGKSRKIRAIRSLFTSCSFCELPNEVVSVILSYFTATELMRLRCVNRKLCNLIDFNKSLWSTVSYQNLWPSTIGEKELFRRGADSFNPESLIKLGLAHLYHYNLTARSEKSEKEVKLNASFAASYFRSLDNRIAPKKPLTWMLVRPPWSSVKSFCLKQAIFDQMNKVASSDAALFYNLGKILNVEADQYVLEKAKDNLELAYDHGCSFGLYEQLIFQKSTENGDKLDWFRKLLECSMNNTEATFTLCNFLIENEKDLFLPVEKAQEMCRKLFMKCSPSNIDRLEHFQPRVNCLMRCILVDWLAEVAYMKDMSHQVLHAAVQYIDRYLMSRVVERAKLQLLGITCLLLAAKSHYDPRQVHILTVRESSWLTDQTYQYDDVVRMMGEVIGTFKGDLWAHTTFDYLNLVLAMEKGSHRHRFLAYYLHDLAVQYTSYGCFKPSLLACAVAFLANIILNQGTFWSQLQQSYTGYEVKDIVNCAALLHYKSFVCPAIKDDRDLELCSVKDRYSSEQMCNVAQIDIPSQDEVKNRLLETDNSLSCVSNDPLQFTVVSTEVDDTLNVSVKSMDYYGDNEDECEGWNSSFEEESFCVGRNHLSAYHSMDEFSDDETTMDSFSVDQSLNKGVTDDHDKDNFTPILPSNLKNGDGFFGDTNNLDCSYLERQAAYGSDGTDDDEDNSSIVYSKGNSVLHSVKNIHSKRKLKRKHDNSNLVGSSKFDLNDFIGKRTRSSSFNS